MATGIFAILKNITLLIDDAATLSNQAATMTKASLKKTAAILGDDLAVNAEKTARFSAAREIPVLIKVTKGSFKNKLILLPVIFLLNIYAHFLITPLLLLGGLYLAYEGAEKVIEWLSDLFSKVRGKDADSNKHQAAELNALKDEYQDPCVIEQKKIKEAIFTDFILSAEIILIALHSSIGSGLEAQLIATTIVALIATIAVYGIVGLIIRIDDLGYWLVEKNLIRIGRVLIKSMKPLIHALEYIGVIAMLGVAGGIFLHNLPFVASLTDYGPEILVAMLSSLSIGTAAVTIKALSIKLFLSGS